MGAIEDIQSGTDAITANIDRLFSDFERQADSATFLANDIPTLQIHNNSDLPLINKRENINIPNQALATDIQGKLGQPGTVKPDLLEFYNIIGLEKTELTNDYGTGFGLFTPEITSFVASSIPTFGVAKPVEGVLSAPTHTPVARPAGVTLTLQDKTPTSITSELPGAVTLANFNILPPPVFDLAGFTDVVPALDVQLPAVSFSHTEADYTSTLKTALSTKLLDDVNSGGSGLDATIETAIYDRTKERDRQTFDDSMTDLRSRWSGSAFSLPNGRLLKEEKVLRDKFDDDKLTRSRDIMKKQAELAQNNTQFSITSALNWEGQLIQHFDQFMRRALDTAIKTSDFGITLFGAEATLYNLRLEKYRTGIQGQEIALKEQSERLELFKAQIANQSNANDHDRLLLEQFGREVEVYNSEVRFFEARTKAADVSQNIDKIKIENFGQRINHFNSIVNADKSPIDFTKSAIDVRDSNLRITDTELKHYETNLNKARDQLNVNKEVFDSNIKEEKAKLEAELFRMQKYGDDVRLAVSKTGAISNALGDDVSMWQTQEGIRNDETRIYVQAKTEELRSQYEQAKIKLQSLQDYATNLLELARTTPKVKLDIANSYAAVLGSILQSMITIFQTGVTENTEN